jgi:hypothetical protein
MPAPPGVPAPLRLRRCMASALVRWRCRRVLLLLLLPCCCSRPNRTRDTCSSPRRTLIRSVPRVPRGGCLDWK